MKQKQQNVKRLDIKRPDLKQLTMEWKPLRPTFLALTAVYVFGIAAIIRANYNYIDDQGRAAYGYKKWEGFGRYLSNFLSNFIHADSYLTDVSPMPQLLAAVIMALAGTLIVYMISGKMEFSWWNVIVLIPVGLSPYFLECFSYKYDAPYMALSVLFSVVPVLTRKCGSYVYVVAAILGILGVCMTYQAASGVFPMLVLVLCLKWWNDKEDVAQIREFLLQSIVGFLLGMVIYKAFIMPPANGYVSNSLPEISQLIPVTMEHLKKYYSLVVSDFKREWIVLVVFVTACFIDATVWSSKQKKIMAFFMACLTMILMALLAFGAYPVLEKPLYEPRAMYGFGVFLALIGIVAVSQKAWYARAVCLMLGWSFFAFSFTYGNALAAQKQYEEFRIEAVVEDLSELDVMKTDADKKIQVVGTIGYAPVIRNMPQDYNMLKRLIPVQFRENWTWGSYQLLRYYGLKNLKGSLSTDLKDAGLPMLKETMYHTIRGNEQNILVELK